MRKRGPCDASRCWRDRLWKRTLPDWFLHRPQDVDGVAVAGHYGPDRAQRARGGKRRQTIMIPGLQFSVYRFLNVAKVVPSLGFVWTFEAVPSHGIKRFFSRRGAEPLGFESFMNSVLRIIYSHLRVPASQRENACCRFIHPMGRT